MNLCCAHCEHFAGDHDFCGFHLEEVKPCLEACEDFSSFDGSDLAKARTKGKDGEE